MDVTEYTIAGEDLEQLLAVLAEGGYTETPAYKMKVRVYPAARQLAFEVNDAGMGMPMGELANVIRA